jgi:hypothetical protein
MYAWFYQQSTVLGLPVAAMFIFMVVFSVQVTRAWLRFRQPSTNQKMSMMPLTNQERTVPANAQLTRGGFHV